MSEKQKESQADEYGIVGVRRWTPVSMPEILNEEEARRLFGQNPSLPKCDCLAIRKTHKGDCFIAIEQERK